MFVKAVTRVNPVVSLHKPVAVYLGQYRRSGDAQGLGIPFNYALIRKAEIQAHISVDDHERAAEFSRAQLRLYGGHRLAHGGDSRLKDIYPVDPAVIYRGNCVYGFVFYLKERRFPGGRVSILDRLWGNGNHNPSTARGGIPPAGTGPLPASSLR
jgi:hypothetical protein